MTIIEFEFILFRLLFGENFIFSSGENNVEKQTLDLVDMYRIIVLFHYKSGVLRPFGSLSHFNTIVWCHNGPRCTIEV